MSTDPTHNRGNRSNFENFGSLYIAGVPKVPLSLIELKLTFDIKGNPPPPPQRERDSLSF